MFYLPKIRALASPLYVFFPHCMPFFTFSSVFHTLSDLLSNLTSFFLTLYSFFLWMTHFFHSFNNSFNFVWQNIHLKKIFNFFREALFKFKISFIQNNAVLFIQQNYSFFWKSRVSDRASAGWCRVVQADVPAWAPEGREGRSQEAIADQGRPWQIKAFWNPRCYQHLWCLYLRYTSRYWQSFTSVSFVWFFFTVYFQYLEMIRFKKRNRIMRYSQYVLTKFHIGCTYLIFFQCKFSILRNDPI